MSITYPIRKQGWWNFLKRVKVDISQKNLGFLAAGVAFYGFLALVSGVAVLIPLCGLLLDPDVMQRLIQVLQGILPGEAVTLLSEPHTGQALGIGLLFGLAVDLWSVHSGGSCLLTAFELACGEKTNRSLFRHETIVLMLAATTMLFVLVSLTLIAVLPGVLEASSISWLGKTIFLVIRWPILVALIMTEFALIYRYAPHRPEPRWRWASGGAVFATLLWIAGSALFAVYVSEVKLPHNNFGALGAVVVLLIWLNLTAFVILLGARIDAVIERRIVQK
jgi:membrane protein